jgi:hypothetical protein
MASEVAAGTRPARQETDYGAIVRLYLLPYFSDELDKDIDAISRQDIFSFWEWRRSFWTTGPGSTQEIIYMRGGKKITRPPARKVPSKSRLGTERTALRQVFNTAVKLGYVQELQIPNLNEPTTGRKGSNNNPKPAFAIEEVRKLYPAMEKWAEEAFGERRWRRELLRDYVDFVTSFSSRARVND